MKKILILAITIFIFGCSENLHPKTELISFGGDIPTEPMFFDNQTFMMTDSNSTAVVEYIRYADGRDELIVTDSLKAIKLLLKEWDKCIKEKK